MRFRKNRIYNGRVNLGEENVSSLLHRFSLCLVATPNDSSATVSSASTIQARTYGTVRRTLYAKRLFNFPGVHIDKVARWLDLLFFLMSRSRIELGVEKTKTHGISDLKVEWPRPTRWRGPMIFGSEPLSWARLYTGTAIMGQTLYRDSEIQRSSFILKSILLFFLTLINELRYVKFNKI